MTRTLHLAQVNIARMKGPLESEVMAGFVARLDEINALADRARALPGACRREKGTPPISDRITTIESCSTSRSGRASSIFGSTSIGARDVEVLRNRQEWFSKFETAYLALWWIPAGHRPSVDEAKKRLAHLDEHGPTAFAFTFRVTFPPDPAVVQAVDWSAFEPCPATSGS